MALARYKRISLENVGAGWTDQAFLEIQTPEPEKIRKRFPKMTALMEDQAGMEKLKDSEVEAEVKRFMAMIVVRGKVYTPKADAPKNSDNLELIDLVESDFVELFILAADRIVDVIAGDNSGKA